MGAIGRKERGRLRCPAPIIVAGASRPVLAEPDRLRALLKLRVLVERHSPSSFALGSKNHLRKLFAQLSQMCILRPNRHSGVGFRKKNSLSPSDTYFPHLSHL